MTGVLVEEIYGVFKQCGGQVSTDSRVIRDGGLFFALRGPHFDGNRFAEVALEKGCAAVVIDDPACYKPDGRHILVANALQSLQALGSFHRQALRGTLQILAVTGSNGKTTTKELIRAVLREKFGAGCIATEGNLNNEIGVPLTLLTATAATSVLILEMGANHPGEIGQLAAMSQPCYGLITNIGRAHLEGFGSRANVLRTKKELFDNLRQRAGSLAFVNSDEEELMQAAEGLDRFTYGTTEAATVRGKVVSCNPYLVFEWQKRVVETQLVGGYNLYNALAAVSAGLFYDVPAEDICRGIAGYTPSNNRSQLQKSGRNILFIDAYNANPDSMTASLRNFSGVSGARKAVILGDMRELGPSSGAFHGEIIELLRSCSFEKVYLCGKEFFHFSVQESSFRFFQRTEDLLDELGQHPLEGFHILIKGSRGMSLEKAVSCL
jgi:UDP-N-acetylmuramoyl-tripeptide--D-alanyl-D-alanine ligase